VFHRRAGSYGERAADSMTKTTQRQRRLDAIVRLGRRFKAQPRPSWTERAHFGIHRVLRVRRAKVSVSYILHVVPPGGGEGSFRSSVMVWTTAKRIAGKAPDWTPALARAHWYETCQRVLRRYGYRGKWRRSQWGRFGDFWKSHLDGRSLEAEIATFDKIQAEPWQSWATP